MRKSNGDEQSDDMDKSLPTERSPKIEVLPEVSHELDPFTPVTVHSTDEETTIADLQHLNNHLAISAAVLPHVKTLAGLCMLSQSVCRLLETRRNVKKLPYGQPKEKSTGKTFEVIE